MGYEIKFIAFKGLSTFSKLVKFFTRGEYSHIAVLRDDNSLIEVWKRPNKKLAYWGFSTLRNHTKNTPYEIYCLPVKETVYEKALLFYEYLAYRNVVYNYLGVIGFIIPFFTSNGGYFCSEGCWEGLVFADRETFGCIKGWSVSPTHFVNIIQTHGAQLMYQGTV